VRYVLVNLVNTFLFTFLWNISEIGTSQRESDRNKFKRLLICDDMGGEHLLGAVENALAFDRVNLFNDDEIESSDSHDM
jgi:hypothetical protein